MHTLLAKAITAYQLFISTHAFHEAVINRMTLLLDSPPYYPPLISGYNQTMDRALWRYCTPRHRSIFTSLKTKMCGSHVLESTPSNNIEYNACFTNMDPGNGFTSPTTAALLLDPSNSPSTHGRHDIGHAAFTSWVPLRPLDSWPFNQCRFQVKYALGSCRVLLSCRTDASLGTFCVSVW